MEGFEAECYPIKMNYDTVRKQLEDFTETSHGFDSTKHRCWQSDTATIIESKREDGFNDNDCPVTDRTKCNSENNWGEWITSKMDPSLQGEDQCLGTNPPFGKKSYRFCRLGKKCLFMEVETLFWNSADNACNRPQANQYIQNDDANEFVDCV